MINNSKSVLINNLEVNNNKPFILIAGPCAIESRDQLLILHLK